LREQKTGFAPLFLNEERIIMSGIERVISKFLGKFFFSGLWTDKPYLIFILIFVSLIAVAVFWPRYQAWTSRFFTIFFTVLCALSSFLTTAECSPGNEPAQNPEASGSGPSVVQAMENSPVRGSPSDSLPRSAASNSTVASTPSASFFQGLSGQIPAAPDSPGEEVQQQGLPNFLSLPEEDTMEHLLGAAPERPDAPTPATASSSHLPAPDYSKLLLEAQERRLARIEADQLSKFLSNIDPIHLELETKKLEYQILSNPEFIDQCRRLDGHQFPMLEEKYAHLIGDNVPREEEKLRDLLRTLLENENKEYNPENLWVLEKTLRKTGRVESILNPFLSEFSRKRKNSS
jgi:hypothetical protein